MYQVLALFLTILGAASFYLSSRNQRWLGKPLPKALAIPVSVASLIAACVTWVHAFRLDTGIFVFATLLMLLLSFFPLVGSKRRIRR